ncbi:MAG: sigma-54 factor interaction protein, partial [Gemmatimonadetes bacterium]|nr:sigma-54 factor interaction protein [Gemmatimonadota bacterium]
MAEPGRRVVVVWASDSFRTTLADLGTELGVGLLGWEAGAPPVRDAIAVVVMAGGMEADGLDRLGELGPPGPPRFLVGAATDHRIGAAAVRSGASDYFALPADLDLFRRTLERLAREADTAAPAEAFAAEERNGTGFGAMVG